MTRILACLFPLLLLVACSDETGDDDRSSSDSGTSAPLSQPDLGTPEFDPVDETGSPEPEIDSEVTSFFFSYDESASTAARDLSLFAIAEGLRPEPSLGRPFEFLNAEQFDRFGATPAGPFEVSMGLLADTAGDIPVDRNFNASLYALGVNVSGPTLSRDDRPNVVLTLLVDVSGSMETSYASETRSDIRSLLDVVKYGLTRMRDTLKSGDIVNLVTFSTDSNVVFEGLDAGENDFTEAVNALQSEASTNIGDGVNLAYQVANRTFDPAKANRVIILTDALVNTGELDPEVIAQPTTINGLEGIYFSGVGIGNRFNDSVLETLTDVGKGTYSAMITPTDAERLFTRGFNRFIEPAVRNVRFQLTYPQVLDQLQSNAEEISTEREDIQPINFSYDSDQFFLELFSGPDRDDIALDQTIILGIEFEDNAGDSQSVSVEKSLGELLELGTDDIKAAAAVSTLAQLIGGTLDCETVLGSSLFNNPINNDIYALYRQNIQQFCAQEPPYRFLRY